LAICQTANAPGNDGEAGWASYYEFPVNTQTIRLGYRDRGTFAYGFDGTFLDRMKWLALGLQNGDIFIIENFSRKVEASLTRTSRHSSSQGSM
jgi:hypothetical protein